MQKQFFIGKVKVKFAFTRQGFPSLKSISASPMEYKDYMEFGQAALNRKEYGIAAKRFEKAGKRAPGNFIANWQHGKALFLNGDFLGAEKRYTAAIKANKGNHDLYLDHGNCNLELRRFYCALGDFKAAAALLATSHDAYLGIHKAFKGLKRENEANIAFRMHKELKELNSKSWHEYFQSGASLLDDGKSLAALAELDKAVRASRGEESLPLIFRARANLRLGNPSEAWDDLEKAATTNPGIREHPFYLKLKAAVSGE